MATARLRFLSFSVRTMLLLVLLIGAALAWTMHRVRRQTDTVATLEAIGCFTDYASVEPLTIVEQIRMWLGEERPRNVIQVFASGLDVNDADAERLAGLSELVSLTLDDSQVTDIGLMAVRGLRSLDLLSLSGTRVTDEGLAYLPSRSPLRLLSLDRTHVTDAGLPHLLGLTRLEFLTLSNTPITDAGLVHLRGLKCLGQLHLAGTHVTDAGVRALQEALPNLIIRR
jgi:hypothetical protein